MTTINYHNRRFRMVGTSTGDAEAIAGTIFHYRQQGNVIWGTYEGGSVAFGTFTGSVLPGGNLKIRFQHLYTDGTMKSGKGDSRLTILPDGRYRLDETYMFFDDDFSGESAVEEIAH